MKSNNPAVGFCATETARTLDTHGVNPSANQGGTVIVEPAIGVELNCCRPSHKGCGFSENVAPTANTVEGAHAVCYQERVGALCSVDHKAPQNQYVEQSKCIVEQTDPGCRYAVRRLTPVEAARLQGFPDWWCSGIDIPEPSEEDITFWSGVFEAHRKIAGTGSKAKSRTQIVKWLKNPYSESAQLRLWGNGLSLPIASFIMSGIAAACRKNEL
jgi:DNA (cytosine-5)-methyltransferase 1